MASDIRHFRRNVPSAVNLVVYEERMRTDHWREIVFPCLLGKQLSKQTDEAAYLLA